MLVTCFELMIDAKSAQLSTDAADAAKSFRTKRTSAIKKHILFLFKNNSEDQNARIRFSLWIRESFGKPPHAADGGGGTVLVVFETRPEPDAHDHLARANPPALTAAATRWRAATFGVGRDRIFEIEDQRVLGKCLRLLQR